MNRHSHQSYHSDEQLLTRFRSSGSIEALGEVYMRYMELVYGVALRYLRQREQAEDVVLQLFEVLSRKLPAQQPTCFRTYLHELVRNHCIEQLRGQGRLIAIPPATTPEDNKALIQALCNSESRPHQLSYAIDNLSEQQRQCIDRFFIHGQSYADIAASTPWLAKGVRGYIQSGMGELRPSLEKLEQ